MSAYAGYDTYNQLGVTSGSNEVTLSRMQRVAGIELNGEAFAAPYSVLREQPVVEAVVGGEPVVVFYEPHTASALDNQVIALGREVGSVGVFSPIVEGDRLSFSRSREGKDGVFVDEETGSSWNSAGTRHVGTFGGRPAGSPSPLPQRAVVFVGLVQARRVYLSALSRGQPLSQGARSRSPPSQSSPSMGKTQSGPHPNPLPQGEGVLEGCSRGPAWP